VKKVRFYVPYAEKHGSPATTAPTTAAIKATGTQVHSVIYVAAWGLSGDDGSMDMWL
jgi:hypothetical protein